MVGNPQRVGCRSTPASELLLFCTSAPVWAFSYIGIPILSYVSADREDVSTVYTAGDHLSKTYFPTFVEAIRRDNTVILQQRTSGESGGGGFRVRRANLKKLRQIAPLALANGWLTREQAKEDKNSIQFGLGGRAPNS